MAAPAYALIDRAIENLTGKLLEEFIVVALVCALFLFHLRSAMVATLSPFGSDRRLICSPFSPRSPMAIHARLRSCQSPSRALSTENGGTRNFCATGDETGGRIECPNMSVPYS